jgi:hypothetical protein
MSKRRNGRFEDAMRSLEYCRDQFERLFEHRGANSIPTSNLRERNARVRLVELCAEVAEMFATYRRTFRPGWMTWRIIAWLENFDDTWTEAQIIEELKKFDDAAEHDWDEWDNDHDLAAGPEAAALLRRDRQQKERTR